MIIINFSFNKIMAQSTVFTTFLVLILFVPATYLLLKSKMQSKLIFQYLMYLLVGLYGHFCHLYNILYLFYLIYLLISNLQMKLLTIVLS